MDGSTAVVGRDVFETDTQFVTYSPVIDFPSLKLLISLAFGNGWEMRHWDISVAFSNTLPEEPTYVLFLKNMQDNVISGFKRGDYVLLRRNLYGSKTAPKLWCKCLIECLTTLGLLAYQKDFYQWYADHHCDCNIS